MRFGGEIDDGVKLMFRHELIHLIGIGDVGLEELVAIAMLRRYTLDSATEAFEALRAGAPGKIVIDLRSGLGEV